MEIRRNLMDKLKAWRDSSRRKPLVLQGVRQVGKSWLLKKFGQECFADVAYVNFDTMPALKEDFRRTKSPALLVKALALTVGHPIVAGRTLIILDEIQECNEALNSLKYFCEDAPEYAVVCAGSLLGVALNRNGASFPVGKVNFLTLRPVSFDEYLAALEPSLYDVYRQLEAPDPVPEVVHMQLVDAYKAYLAIGGMPEAVSAYADTRILDDVVEVQDSVLTSYTLDFAKHIANADIPRVFQVWGSLQDQLAREDRKFRYADISHGARAREYEAAIEWLRLAGLVHRVNATETPRLPLSAYQKSNAFKLYVSDVGLLCRKFHLTAQTVVAGNGIFTEFKGILAENYVLQSLVSQFEGEPCYWTSGNTAEVEFVIQRGDAIVPVEVKAGTSVTAKSLSLYRSKYSPALSVRLSLRNMRRDDDLLNVPLYLVDRLSEWI